MQKGHLCVCVCVCKGEKKRESECVCLCACVCMCACVRAGRWTCGSTVISEEGEVPETNRKVQKAVFSLCPLCTVEREKNKRASERVKAMAGGSPNSIWQLLLIGEVIFLPNLWHKSSCVYLESVRNKWVLAVWHVSPFSLNCVIHHPHSPSPTISLSSSHSLSLSLSVFSFSLPFSHFPLVCV